MTWGIISIIINLFFLFLLFLYLRYKIKVSSAAPTVLDDIRDEINRMLIEINQTTDRNVGLIEGKLKGLAEMIESADRRITLLQRGKEVKDKTSSVYSNLNPGNIIAVPKKEKIKEKVKKEIVHKTLSSTKDKVIDLYKKGFDAKIIAAKLDTAIGEVELMISLETGRI